MAVARSQQLPNHHWHFLAAEASFCKPGVTSAKSKTCRKERGHELNQEVSAQARGRCADTMQLIIHQLAIFLHAVLTWFGDRLS
ncbi:hypothetical protein AK812_SmicGene29169 [Symbiodinium microadriaticum]|uniref:Uncharacterized protein n=1 Tax=Symbiodinium microadriaticum TaxID=2951 RepID=A0A1Q9D2I1_SYMMI|nr:hypothetical protein AK812_SmicGene29169 [Symbiodinium microadriaticum]